MKRILFLSESVDFISGAEKSMLEVISLFDKGIFECFIGKVKSKEFNDEIERLGINQLDFSLHENKGLMGYIKNIIKAYKILNKNRIDLIYITSSGNYWKPAEILAAKLMGIPIITHLRWWKYRLDSFLKYSDRIICNSSFTAQKLMKSKLRRKTEVVMNFVKFDKLKVKKVKHKGINVAYIGQINPVKGIKYLIDSARLVNDVDNIKFLIVGREAGAYPGYKKEMKKYAKGLKNIKFLDYTSDISSVYNKTDIFVLPSLEEPFGRVLVEAGYFGIPCVASRVGGIPEVIDEKTGILVNPRDSRGIAEAIKRLAEDKGLRKRLGEEARKKVVEEFNPSKQIKRIEEICSGLIRK